MTWWINQKKLLKEFPNQIFYPTDVAVNVDGERVDLPIEKKKYPTIQYLTLEKKQSKIMQK